MKEFDFTQLKAVVTPEKWIDDALKIPQKKIKPRPRFLLPSVLGSAAAVIIVIAAVLTIFIHQGTPSPAEPPMVLPVETTAAPIPAETIPKGTEVPTQAYTSTSSAAEEAPTAATTAERTMTAPTVSTATAPTQTQPVTQPVTQAPTQPPTQAATEPPTQAATVIIIEPTTQTMIEPVTDPATEPPDIEDDTESTTEEQETQIPTEKIQIEPGTKRI